MLEITPKAVITAAALGNEAVDMRGPFQVSAKSMKDHDEVGNEVHGFVLLREHAGDCAGDGMKKAVKEGSPQLIILSTFPMTESRGCKVVNHFFKMVCKNAL